MNLAFSSSPVKSVEILFDLDGLVLIPITVEQGRPGPAQHEPCATISVQDDTLAGQHAKTEDVLRNLHIPQVGAQFCWVPKCRLGGGPLRAVFFTGTELA